MDTRPLIAHIVLSFDYGGLENGVANVINGLPEASFRHAVVALTTVTDFRGRIHRPDVTIHELHKKPGKDPGAYVRLFSLLRKLQPTIVHTRNLSTVDAAVVARLAGVPSRIHGEHGWDVFDPDGTSRKFRALRRVVNPVIDRFVAVSQELERWLVSTVGIQPAKVQRICNGVDTERFRPREGAERSLLPADRFPPHSVVVGTVTRFSTIKDPLNIVRAFIEARRDSAGSRLRLVMAGDGELRAQAEAQLKNAGAADAAWLTGSRDDVPTLLRDLDVFVLGSRREGISNTILEAMSAGLPVIATATGGNGELVESGVTGRLVQPGSAEALANALLVYSNDVALRRAHGQAARRRAVEEFSLRRMLGHYEALYRACAGGRRGAA